jgi:ribosomal protein S18 acetylase RimI-like enzyme
MAVTDIAVAQEIERAAGVAFIDVGLPEIAADEPFSSDELQRYIDRGHAWVVAPDGGRVMGYLVTDVVDGFLHIEQVSVHPDAAHQGLGRRLIEHVASVARAEGRAALTLTTFRAVPWNAPYYERCGFRVVAEDDLGPELRAVRDHEATLGLDPALRVCMRRDLPPG